MLSSIFQSARLVYRAIEEDDVDKAFLLSLLQDATATANSDPRLMKPRNKDAPNGFIQWIRNDALLGVMICLPQSSSELPTKPIGFIMLEKIKDQEHHRKAIIAVGIEAEQQGKGYGSEAIRWILNWAFQIAGLHRVAIGCFSFNAGARRLYERLNFVYEGRERESLWFNGKWHDVIWLSMLEGEWREHYGKDIDMDDRMEKV